MVTEGLGAKSLMYVFPVFGNVQSTAEVLREEFVPLLSSLTLF